MPDPGNFHPWDAMAPAALEAIRRRGPFENTVETGCGGSTIVLSQNSAQHTAFAIEGDDHTISELRTLVGDNVTFVDGKTRDTIPRHTFREAIDLILLDGPHAYPLPQLEYEYLFPQLRVGGWLVLDDIHIPAVYELFRFLKKEPTVAFEEVVLRTAFFRKIRQAEASPDNWQQQGMNRTTKLRYSWRDRLRRYLGR